jgi:hypothetical protein
MATVESDADERNTQVSTLLTVKMSDGFSNGHFEGRLHQAGQKMAAAERAILQANNRVQMKARVSVVALRYIPD